MKHCVFITQHFALLCIGSRSASRSSRSRSASRSKSRSGSSSASRSGSRSSRSSKKGSRSRSSSRSKSGSPRSRSGSGSPKGNHSLFFYLYTLIDSTLLYFNLIESLKVHGQGLRQFREVNLLLHLEAHGLHLRNLAQKHQPFILIKNVLKKILLF